MGLPGDRVAIINGIFYLNGKPYENDSNIFVNDKKMYSDMEEMIVPEDSIFVMGDNRNNSKDSRSPSCGPIPHSAIKGKSLCIILPLDKVTAI
jgi:signal peptidase I